MDEDHNLVILQKPLCFRYVPVKQLLGLIENNEIDLFFLMI